MLFGHEARRIFGHSVVSMFIGTIPMGLATILNGALAFALPRFGVEVVGWVQAFWWLDVAMAVACGVGIPFLMFTRQQHSIDGPAAGRLAECPRALGRGGGGGQHGRLAGTTPH